MQSFYINLLLYYIFHKHEKFLNCNCKTIDNNGPKNRSYTKNKRSKTSCPLSVHQKDVHFLKHKREISQVTHYVQHMQRFTLY